MAEKTLKTRIIQKHDTEANWLLATNFTPLNGEIIIYDEDDNHDYKRIKIGNGTDNVNDLDFVVNKEDIPTQVQVDWKQSDENALDYIKNKPFGSVVGKDFLEYTTYEGVWYEDDPERLFYMTEVNKELEEGKSYQVNYDGIKYTCVCKQGISDDDTAKYLGNFRRLKQINGESYDSIEDTGEPFIITISNNVFVMVIFKTTSKNFCLGIKEIDIDYLDPVYIKDMYYTEGGESNVVYEGVNVEFEHVTEEEDEIGENYSLYLDTVIEPQTGYLIDWDGTAYRCTSTELMDVYVFLGNQSYIGGEDTGEPFFMMCVIEQNLLAIVTFDLTKNTHNVKIYTGTTETVHQIPSKYVDAYTKSEIDVKLNNLDYSELAFDTTDIVSDDVAIVYVTFMNTDGTKELYKMPITPGSDCPDIVAEGIILAQTKESSVQYVYAQNGWTSTIGSDVENDILLNVTSDKTVYPSFSKELKKHTVNFYDGDTLIDTVRVVHGGTASTSNLPSKDGYRFRGFVPTNENITQNTDCYAQWVEDDGIITDDWDEISQYTIDGTYSARYKVGDIKDLTVTYSDGTNEIIPMRVVQLDSQYDRHTDDKTKYAKLVFIADNLLRDDYQMKFDTTHPAYQYYPSTNLYQYLNGEFLTYLPQNLQNVLVDVFNGHVNSSETGILKGGKGKVWIPSLVETINYTYSNGNFRTMEYATSKQYDEFKGEKYSSFRQYTKVGSDETSYRWFSTTYRSATSGYAYQHVYLDKPQTSSSPYFNQALDSYNVSCGVLIGFCLG